MSCMAEPALHCEAKRAVLLEQACRFKLIDTEFVHDHARATVDKLVVAQHHVDHFIALDSSQLYHCRCRYHVKHKFLCRARFHSCTSRHKLGANNHLDGIVCVTSKFRVLVTGNTTCSDAMFPCR